MIEIRNLCKSFGEHVIFDNFNAVIKDGEFVVFAGKSGCGKTTLLNIIGALEEPDSGSVLVNGLDVNQRKNQKKLFQKYGGIFVSKLCFD